MENQVEDPSLAESEAATPVPVARSLRLSVLLSTGDAFLDQKRYGIARRLYFEALAKRPWSIRALAGLGRVYNETGEPELSLKYLRRLMVYRTNWMGGLSGYGHAFSLLEDYATSEKWYLRALATDPSDRSVSLALGITQLRLGKWTAGFARYEMRESVVSLCKTVGPEMVWDGRTDIRGSRFLIVGEQGFGDHIHFMRYSKLLKDRGAHVVFFTRPELKELASWVPWIDEIVVDREKVTFDIAAMAMSLPYLFATTCDLVPLTEPYIQVPDSSVTKEQPDKPAKKRILLAWKGNAQNSRDPVRSAPPGLVADLMRGFPDIDFHALPFDLPLDKDTSLTELTPICGIDSSFADVARAMGHIDLVITVDTSLAHLAAAMGKPTWILIGKQPDWRWLASGEDSIWYDTARLFRVRESWQEVFDRVSDSLRAGSSSWSPRNPKVIS